VKITRYPEAGVGVAETDGEFEVAAVVPLAGELHAERRPSRMTAG